MEPGYGNLTLDLVETNYRPDWETRFCPLNVMKNLYEEVRRSMKLRYKWLYFLIPAVLIIGIIGTAVWGYQEMGTRQNCKTVRKVNIRRRFMN